MAELNETLGFLSNPLVIIGLIAGGGLVVLRLAAWMMRESSKSAKESQDKLEKELRDDIRQAREDNQKLMFRLQEMEKGTTRLQTELDENRKLLATMRVDQEALQAWREKAQRWIEDKDRRIAEQEAENKQLERELSAVIKRNEVLEVENRTYRQALTLIGAKLPKGDDAREPAESRQADGADVPPDDAPEGAGSEANDG